LDGLCNGSIPVTAEPFPEVGGGVAVVVVALFRPPPGEELQHTLGLGGLGLGLGLVVVEGGGGRGEGYCVDDYCYLSYYFYYY